MSISFGSIGTGLPKDIVQKLIEVEKLPLQALEGRKEKIASKRKLVQELITLVEKMNASLGKNASAKDFREFKVFANDQLVDVTIDKAVAETGNHQFSVENLAQKSTAVTSGFEDPDKSYLGVGFIQYSLPDGTVNDLYVDSDNASLRGVAKLINGDPSNGMTARVVEDGSGSDTPWRLVISLQQSGDDFNAEFPYFYFVDGEDDFYLENDKQAKDAKVTLDGYPIEKSSNKITDLIPGLTIDLKKAAPGEQFNIKIVEDYDLMTDKVVGIVDEINEVLRFINNQNNLDQNSDTSRTLGGDITLQTLEGRIRTEIFTPVETQFGPTRLGQFGIRFQKNGLLEIDDKKFQASLTGNVKQVIQTFVGHFNKDSKKVMGIVDRFRKLVKGTIGIPSGMLQTRKSGLGTNIKSIDRQIENRQRIIDRKEQSLRDKFARLESVMSKLKSQGAGLSALNSPASNPITQLG